MHFITWWAFNSIIMQNTASGACDKWSQKECLIMRYTTRPCFIFFSSVKALKEPCVFPTTGDSWISTPSLSPPLSLALSLTLSCTQVSHSLSLVHSLLVGLRPPRADSLSLLTSLSSSPHLSLYRTIIHNNRTRFRHLLRAFETRCTSRRKERHESDPSW